MTDSNKPAPKKRGRPKKTEEQPIAVVPADQPAEEQRAEGDHDGFPDNAKPEWANPKSAYYNPFPENPLNGEQHTPVAGGFVYTYDGTAGAWMAYERGYRGPEGPQGPEGFRGPRGDVAACVECPTPPTTATRGIFYLTNSNVLLIGI
nr:hypothetical protein [uncultured Mediterranean phage uvMED]